MENCWGDFTGTLVIGMWHDENAKWEKFKVEHGCKVVEHIKGDIQTGVGITTNGNVGMMVIPESDKTGYLCDDGVTYWR
ncbi:hypothetical protein LVJ85_11035 [Neisseria sp. Dent CA1/247]|uniref:hypothetical protein n=1 Tax=Neisseria sp. Dent CA1/247 TaxID=2912675 RepID=UPI001FD31030|nr:hypothetical protein [Neisseria sp. Dent CA1/247]UOO76529.1 hypothetical protein LVJ85_11035 [Neisseria sp. Dent CA1/247]